MISVIDEQVFLEPGRAGMKLLSMVVLALTLAFSSSAWSIIYDFEDPGQLDDWEVIQGKGRVRVHEVGASRDI